MNIDDVKITVPKPPLIPRIFEHQRKLMVRYDEIERKNGFFVPEHPYSIDDAKVQARIKDLFWRTVEEIGEAMECTKYGVCHISHYRAHNTRHFMEELADATHFLVEASIVSNLIFKDDDYWNRVFIGNMKFVLEENFRITTMKFIENITLAANTLKNKPWKQSQMQTDVCLFFNKFREAWENFLHLWAIVGADLEDVYALYMKKKVVNEFRQRSNY